MCESDPTLEQPMCVKWCVAEALIYEEREVEVTEEEDKEEIEIGLEAMAHKFGWETLLETAARMSKKG
jgi:benzoyl-CoA reductase subunit BamC